MNLSAQVVSMTGAPPPPGVDALEAAATRLPGWSAVPPDPELHPLLVPLVNDGEGVVGLLTWPTAPEGWPVPVVRSHGRWLELLAGSVEDYVRHTLMRAEAADQLDEALEAACGGLYSRGERAMTGLDPVAWVILKAGGAPWAYHRRIAAHHARGDGLSALVATERVCERFPGWAELHRWRWRALRALDRDEEATEAATAAMALPIWTLQEEFEALALAIGWSPPIDASPFRRRALDPATLPADRAAWWMDWASGSGAAWSSLRPALAEAYAAAGLARTAAQVSGAAAG